MSDILKKKLKRLLFLENFCILFNKTQTTLPTNKIKPISNNSTLLKE